MRISDWSSDVCSSDLLRKFADEQRDHAQDRARGRHPEAEIVEERKADVARADLKRHDIVHQPGDEGHRDEKAHDLPVLERILFEVMCGQINLRTAEPIHGLFWRDAIHHWADELRSEDKTYELQYLSS